MTLDEASHLIAGSHFAGATQQTWADLGCGSGLFSRALLGLLPRGSTVYALDQQVYSITDPGIHFIQADFVHQNLDLPSLDGILMANSLHFVADKMALLQRLKGNLMPQAAFLLIEYDTQRGNPWVPYPLSFAAAQHLFNQAGFQSLGKTGEKPSLYGRAKIYAALFINSPDWPWNTFYLAAFFYPF